MSEREEALSSEREIEQLLEIIFMFLGFTAAICAYSISEEVARFSPLWFPQGKFFVSVMIFVVHVILSDKILHHIA